MSRAAGSYVRLERRVIETVYQLLLRKAKVLTAGSSSGSGVEALAENFFRRWRPMGSLGESGSAVAWSRGRQFFDKVYGGFWKNSHLFYVVVHVLLAHEICDESGGLPEGGPGHTFYVGLRCSHWRIWTLFL